MSKWITDRRPTLNDTKDLGFVWVTSMETNVVHIESYDRVYDRPWKPIDPPEPYNEPKKCLVFPHEDGSGFYKIYVNGIGVCAYHLPTREAANRIAAIYEEVMP